MSTKPITWKSSKAVFTYYPDQGVVYREIFGQGPYLFCGTLPRNLETVEAVKQALLVQKLAGSL